MSLPCDEPPVAGSPASHPGRSGAPGLLKIRGGRVIWANRGLERMLGAAPLELAGRMSTSLAADGSPVRDFHPVPYPTDNSEPDPCELYLRHRDGSAVWVEAEIARYDVSTDDSLWVVTDITARKRADDSIRTTRTFLDRISSVAGVGGWRYDIESGVMTWSDETCRLHDLPPGHVPTLDEAMGYLSRDGRVALVDALERAVDAHTPWDVEVLMTSAKGRPFWARAVGILESEDGRPVRLIGTFQDVTKERHAAEALRDTLRRLEVLFNNSPDSMSIARAAPDGSFVYEAVNPVWERVTGVAAAAAIGHAPAELFPRGLADIVVERWNHCVTAGEPVIFTFDIERNGVGRLWESLVVPVLVDGRVDRMLGIARDITERTEIEAKLRRMQRMDAVGQLTAGIAHDFNNLLHTMMAALEMLRGFDPQRHDAPEFQDCARVAHNAAQRAATLVHRLLAFSHKQPLTPVAVQPGELLGDLVGLLRTAVGRSITLETTVDTDWCIQADRAQLENCLINLAVNARDAMPDGGLLRLSVEPATSFAAGGIDAPRGQYVRLTVEDDGPGMPAETLARAAEPFFTTKPMGKGTGLGLSMVQGFARQSGGDLAIRSAPGQGTAVSLWLPRAAAAGEPAVGKW